MINKMHDTQIVQQYKTMEIIKEYGNNKIIVYENKKDFWDCMEKYKIGTLYKQPKGQIIFKKSWQTEVLTGTHIQALSQIIGEELS